MPANTPGRMMRGATDSAIAAVTLTMRLELTREIYADERTRHGRRKLRTARIWAMARYRQWNERRWLIQTNICFPFLQRSRSAGPRFGEGGQDETAQLVSVAILDLRMKLNQIGDAELKALCEEMHAATSRAAPMAGPPSGGSAASPRQIASTGAFGPPFAPRHSRPRCRICDRQKILAIDTARGYAA